MANNIDSLDLRQIDLSAGQAYRTDTKKTAATDSFYDHENRTDTWFDQYSRFPSRKEEFSHPFPDVRFINPAIYAEPVVVAEEESIEPIKITAENDLVGRLSSLSIKENLTENRHNGRSTYRCPAAETSSTLASSRAESGLRVLSCTIGKPQYDHQQQNDFHQQPEVQRYALNGTRVVEISTASSSNISESGGLTGRFSQAKAYEEWARKKKAEALRRKEEEDRIRTKSQGEEDRLAKEKREYRERENFLQWTERKRREEALKREAAEREMEFEKRFKDVENKTMVSKMLYLRQWNRKKLEEQKALQKKQAEKKKREDDERKKRIEESVKAYEKWTEISKNRPRPATQGLLPHQKATPSYINPNPWVSDRDE